MPRHFDWLFRCRARHRWIIPAPLHRVGRLSLVATTSAARLHDIWPLALPPMGDDGTRMKFRRFRLMRRYRGYGDAPRHAAQSGRRMQTHDEARKHFSFGFSINTVRHIFAVARRSASQRPMPMQGPCASGRHAAYFAVSDDA